MDQLHTNDESQIESLTLGWVQRVVLGLNLCPFAHPVIKAGGLSVRVHNASELSDVLTTAAEMMQDLANTDGDATSLLVLPNGFAEFDDYLDLAAMADALLDDLDLLGVVQVATFHPDYQFEGSMPNDASNYTNRSPYPMLHFLQEAAVEIAVSKHPDAESIPQRNIDLLENMDRDELAQVVNGSDIDTTNQHL